MIKQEFIDILLKHEATAGLFQGRFSRTYNQDGSMNDDFWDYNRPAVDCFEPSINLSADGHVLYENYDGFTNVEPKVYTYEEFIQLYNLDK
jgi:hypothetical protein